MNDADLIHTMKATRQWLNIKGAFIVWSWAAHGWKALAPSHGWDRIGITNPTLQFKVRAHHFKGHVRIEYIEGVDLYNIHFGHYRKTEPNRWKNLETVEQVYGEDLADIIDKRIEYIKEYAA